MIAILVLAAASWFAATLAPRALWRAAKSGVFEVPGGPFDRTATPVTSWSGIGFCGFGLLLNLALGTISTYPLKAGL